MVLIKNKNVKPELPEPQKVLDISMQESSALALANARNKENKTTAPLFLLRVEDPKKIVNYLVTKLIDDRPVLCEFVGFEATQKEVGAFSSVEEAANYVKEAGSVRLVNIKIPWTRVISIENITYKHKRSVK